MIQRNPFKTYIRLDEVVTKLMTLVAVVSSVGLLQDTASVAQAEEHHNRSVRVFILAGQSNAVGYNDVRQYRDGKADLPEEYRNQPGVLFWDAKEKTWITLRVGESGGSTANAFGPEIGFAHELARLLPNEQIAIVKCAVGSTGIARSRDYHDYIPSLRNFNDAGRNWHPPSDGQEAGLLYQRLIKDVGDAVLALRAEGRKYELSAFLWMQGEHEAGISPKMAGDYEGLLKSLIQAVRTDLKSPQLPVVVGEVNSHSWAYADIVRNAQLKVCREDGHALVVKTTDLSRKGSGGAAHFDADGTLGLGSRVAVAVSQLLDQGLR